MRLQSEIKVTVRKTVIGGADPLVCLPLQAVDKHELLEQAMVSKRLQADLVEWRIDAYEAVDDIAGCVEALAALRGVLADTPLIFTCRIEAEGGRQPITQSNRRALIDAAVRSGDVDIVDVELCNDAEFIQGIQTIADGYGVKLILSYHDFEKTPDADFLRGKLEQAQALGADIAKVAAMPKNYQDVLTLLEATLRARTGSIRIPMITVSMAGEGLVTRVAGGLFGSDVTFATGRTASAPGQIPVGALRRAMAVLFR